MALLLARGRPSAERSRGPLWRWPAVAGSAAVAAGLALCRIRPRAGTAPAALWWGDVEAGSAALQTIATAVMTATTLTFSVTVVALQLASQQFSPRLLREFTRDPVIKAVLAVLVATFGFSLASLSALRADRGVPDVALLVAVLLGLLSLAAILAFITHIVRALRVDTLMLMVHDETDEAIRLFYPHHDESGLRSPDDLGLDAEVGRTVAATTSGFVQVVTVDALVACARDRGALVRVEVRPGDHIVRGAPIATIWRHPSPGGTEGAGPDDELDDGVRRAVVVGYERTLDQDAGFGFRQLEDIAVKAMSPSVNDPVTAAHAVGHMSDLLVRLLDRHLGPLVHHDEDGEPRAIVPDRDLTYYLDLAAGQLRRYASREPTVLAALLRMLRDGAVACRDDRQRAAIRAAADLVAAAVDHTVSEADAASVHDLRDRVEQALGGAVVEAYADRAGETRSI